MPPKALIIVDMLNDFIDKNGALYCGDTVLPIVPFIQQRLKSFRDRSDLVIHLQDSHDEDDKEFEKFPKHSVTGSWGSEIIKGLAPLPGETVLPKKRFSGFFRTGLEDVLASAGVEEAEVVGVCTSICVMDTVGGLVNRDYKVNVPIKGVADFDPEAHQFSLKRMEKIYGANIS